MKFTKQDLALKSHRKEVVFLCTILQFNRAKSVAWTCTSRQWKATPLKFCICRLTLKKRFNPWTYYFNFPLQCIRMLQRGQESFQSSYYQQVVIKSVATLREITVVLVQADINCSRMENLVKARNKISWTNPVPVFKMLFFGK